MQANSTPMAEIIGKQHRTIEELQAELAKLKGEVLTLYFGQSYSMVLLVVNVNLGCAVKARSWAVDTITELSACHDLCVGCNACV